MIPVEIVAKATPIALTLAAALAEDDRLRVVRAEALPFAYRPHPDAEVIIAIGVSLPAMPGAGPKVILLADGTPGIRRHPSVRASLPLDATPAEIAAAAIAAQAGLYALTASQFPVVRQHRGGDIIEEQLTPREVEVLRLVADGATNRDIAAELGISSNTAKFHVAQVLAKLNAASRAEAVQIGIRRGLVLL